MRVHTVCWLGIFLFLLAAGCRRDRTLYTGSDARLSLSSDTVYFDTVFTQLAGTTYPRSVNKQFFIVNRHSRTVKTRILLGGGTTSPYRINVDGVAATAFNDIEIPAQDSLIAFVEVTLEANNQINPAIVLDSIMFTTNGNEQKVILAAYGWDAFYFRDSVVSANTVWDNTEKPYVIVNHLIVDENTTLRILPSVTVYSSPGASLFVAGTLSVEGTEQNPAVFQGDRLQPAFKEVAGQWRGIHILRTSVNSEIRNAVVKNADIGVRIDSLSNNSNPKLRISRTLVKNCAFFGVLGVTATLHMENVAVARCGSNGFVAYFGGDYTVRHCTFASGFLGGRSQPAVALNNMERDDKDNFVRSFSIAYRFENCIIYGSLDDELILDIHSGTPPVLALFDHCLIKTDLYKETLTLNNNILNTDPKLNLPREADLTLKADSPAKGRAKELAPPVLVDLQGNSRSNPATLGAYEGE